MGGNPRMYLQRVQETGSMEAQNGVMMPGMIVRLGIDVC